MKVSIITLTIGAILVSASIVGCKRVNPHPSIPPANVPASVTPPHPNKTN